MDRVTMVPLFATPHDWHVLDANVGIYSTRYAMLRGALLLYPRFEALTKDGKGTWFSAYTPEGRLTGVSTARIDEHGSCQVDGSTHRRFGTAWRDLIEAGVDWAASKGVSSCHALVSVDDEEKRSLFEELGFHKAGTGPDFELGDRTSSSIRMER